MLTTPCSPRASKRGNNLGLPNAHEADLCLDCHADNVPTAMRGPEFDITDGVGCEACHGGSETWAALHTVDTVPADELGKQDFTPLTILSKPRHSACPVIWATKISS